MYIVHTYIPGLVLRLSAAAQKDIFAELLRVCILLIAWLNLLPA